MAAPAECDASRNGWDWFGRAGQLRNGSIGLAELRTGRARCGVAAWLRSEQVRNGLDWHGEAGMSTGGVEMIETLTFDSREAWLEARKGSLGSSDMPAICGRSPYRTALDVWAEKTGKIEREDAPTVRMRVGSAMEPVTLELLRMESRHYAVPESTHTMFREGKQHSTPDGRFSAREWVDDGSIPGPRGPVEMKAVGAFAPQSWRTKIPDHVVIQLAHHMPLWPYEATHGIAAGLIQGDELLWKMFERDTELERKLEAIGDQFWQEHVEKDIPPEPGSKDLDTVRALFPRSRPKSVIESFEHDEGIDLVENFTAEVKWREAAIAEHKARIMLALGEHDEGVTPTGRRVTWKTTAAGHRTLNILKRKWEK